MLFLEFADMPLTQVSHVPVGREHQDRKGMKESRPGLNLSSTYILALGLLAFT